MEPRAGTDGDHGVPGSTAVERGEEVALDVKHEVAENHVVGPEVPARCESADEGSLHGDPVLVHRNEEASRATDHPGAARVGPELVARRQRHDSISVTGRTRRSTD